MPESALQSMCEDYLELRHVPFLHIPDQAYKLCAQRPGASGPEIGLKRAVADAIKGKPDMFIFKPGCDTSPVPCLMCELKTEDGKLSQAQTMWAREVPTAVARSFEEFQALVDAFLESKPLHQPE